MSARRLGGGGGSYTFFPALLTKYGLGCCTIQQVIPTRVTLVVRLGSTGGVELHDVLVSCNDKISFWIDSAVTENNASITSSGQKCLDWRVMGLSAASAGNRCTRTYWRSWLNTCSKTLLMSGLYGAAWGCIYNTKALSIYLHSTKRGSKIISW